MKIHHIALWTENLEIMAAFYEKYFSAVRGSLYVNEKKGFSSYFLTFSDGAKLELMHSHDIVPDATPAGKKRSGYIHIAVSVGSKEEVDRMTAFLETDGYTVTSCPRVTGDGYYESCILDPDGNLVEIVG